MHPVLEVSVLPRYTAVVDAPDGQKRETLSAPSLPAALLKLREQTDKVGQVEVPGRTSRRAPAQLPGETLVSAYRQIASLLSKGIGVSSALDSVARDCPDDVLAYALRRMSVRTSHGMPLYEAMQPETRIFPPEACGVVQAAEVSGKLPEALEGLAQQAKTMVSLQRKSTLLLIYPVIVCLMGLAILGFYISFIAPKMIRLYSELGLTEDHFPLSTLFMSRIAFAFPYLVELIIALALVLLVLRTIWRRTPAGRLRIYRWRMMMPMAGRVTFAVAIGRMCSTLAMLLEHRVPAPLALSLAGEASGSETLAVALRRGGTVAAAGGSIAEALGQAKAIPRGLLWRIKTGEDSGTLTQAARSASQLYIEASEAIAARTAEVAGPVIIIVLGLLVGAAIISMFAPLVTIVGQLSQ